MLAESSGSYIQAQYDCGCPVWRYSLQFPSSLQFLQTTQYHYSFMSSTSCVVLQFAVSLQLLQFAVSLQFPPLLCQHCGVQHCLQHCFLFWDWIHDSNSGHRNPLRHIPDSEKNELFYLSETRFAPLLAISSALVMSEFASEHIRKS